MNAGESALFTRRLRELARRPLVTASPRTPARDVARLLSSERVGSVVILDGGAAAGIVTDRDLRARIVEAGRDPAATPAAAIMSAPVVTAPAAALAFDALVLMTRHRIRHVVVEDDGRAAGVVSSRDLLELQAAHPVGLIRDIERAASIDALAALAPHVTALVGRLLAAGATVRDIARLVAELNDRLVIRVLDHARAELAAAGHEPPLPWAWLAFGSEGRREQTLWTDQDNGLVYADPEPALAEASARYFTRLAEAAVAGLLAIGFPPCPGGAMASNPRWCQPRGVWEGYIEGWIGAPSPEHILAASMYFDLRMVTGEARLAAALADRIRTEAPRHAPFLARMARDVVDRRVPVTLLGGVGVQRSGPHRGAVDIKGAGSIQVVGAARVHALELGLAATNTVERLEGAAERGLYTPAELVEITDAYEHLLRLRLAHQLARIEAGATPDNYIDPDALSHRDALLLRDALKTVARVQGRLRERYATDFIPT